MLIAMNNNACDEYKMRFFANALKTRKKRCEICVHRLVLYDEIKSIMLIHSFSFCLNLYTRNQRPCIQYIVSFRCGEVTMNHLFTGPFQQKWNFRFLQKFHLNWVVVGILTHIAPNLTLTPTSIDCVCSQTIFYGPISKYPVLLLCFIKLRNNFVA